MTSYQNALDYAKDQMQQGNVTAAEANVMIVQMMGVRVIAGSLPKDIRKALNDAVRAGELGHIKKDGMRPEVYHHKNGRANALEVREREYRRGLEAIKNTCAYNPIIN